MDLFSQQPEHDEAPAPLAPLAARMRPRTLAEFVGQEHIVGERGPLRAAIAANDLFSMIFYGPPGTGKTTLARVIANDSTARFVQLSAVNSGAPDVRNAVQAAREALTLNGRPTILFIDEIHRFNKAQQDALLPAIEDGLVAFIGATTENPYFEANSALLSRCQLFRFEPLSADEMRVLVEAGLSDTERGLGAQRVALETSALDHVVDVAHGDARAAHNLVEAAWRARRAPGDDGVVLTLDDVSSVSQALPIAYDRRDAHYDTISAFIKSVRGGDADAAVYYLASLLAGGEDPKFIARRLIILASEDIGNADPQGLVVAVAASRAVEFVGLPEARISLAQATTYLALAPKSNAAYKAIEAAAAEVAAHGNLRPPPHLRDASYRGARTLGHGIGYQYPHNDPQGWVDQQYLPDELSGERYYVPIRGIECALATAHERLRGTPAQVDDREE